MAAQRKRSFGSGMPWIFRSQTSEKSRFWCSGLQRLISSISTDSAPHTVAGVCRKVTPALSLSGNGKPTRSSKEIRLAL